MSVKKYLLISFFLLTAAIIAACSNGPKPEDRFAAYVKLWNEQKFAEMYDYLSAESQEKITKESFVNRHTKVYKDLELNNVKATFTEPQEGIKPQDGQITYPFAVKMDSIAGEISFDHQAVITEEERDKEKNWYINWDTTFIFPELNEGDKIALSTIPAKRGDILDKNGKGLAVTGKAYEIGIVPAKMGEQKANIIKEAAKLLDISPEQIEKSLNASWVQPEHFVPLKKIAQTDTELLEKLLKIDSVLKRDVEARVYPLGEAAAHLIGYVGPITADELKKMQEKGYRSTDIIGKRGLEQVLEDRLKGENGVKIAINKKDGTSKLLAQKEVKNGENVQLTIDSSLQKEIFSQFKGDAGMASAIQPVTGETLALVSSPSFDPNIVTLGAPASYWKKLQDDDKKPLLNRFKSTYAPGSVIKPMTAAIGLSEGIIDWKQSINVKGLDWQKDPSWGSYYITRVTDPKTAVDLEKALLYSDNIYFAQATLKLGKDKFTSGLKNFGFEEKIPYPYPIETSRFGNIDSEIKLADSGYGQGQVEMSILHLASTYTPLLNDGNMIQPILLADEEKGKVWKEDLISEDQVQKLNNTLSKVIADPNGTAYTGKNEVYHLAGKTGTAELKASKDAKGQDNGWFVAYNTDKPTLLIAMMVEGVEKRGGSMAAVEKVKNIFKK